MRGIQSGIYCILFYIQRIQQEYSTIQFSSCVMLRVVRRNIYSSKNTMKEYTRNIYSYCIFGGMACALSEYNRIHYILKCISVVGYILLSCLERHFGIQQEYIRNTQEYSVLSVKHNIYSIIQGP